MENEIKVGEYIRTNWGHIGKLKRIELDKNDKGLKWYVFDHKEFEEEYINKPYIVKHSPNLIDLIQCGDYVNGKEVIMDLQKSKEWYKSEDDFITCKDYTFEENEIKEIVTKEQMESITYKVTKM